MTERIAKFIAGTGFASRRDAERLIAAGRVTINGARVDTPVTFVNENDEIAVDGVTLHAHEKIKLYAFHKPVGTMTTSRDPERRKTVYDVLDAQYKNLKYVGRLDYNTSGLLLMTNDGDLARKLTLPSSNISRTYIATVSHTDDNGLNRARRGVTVRGIKYRPMQIDVIQKNVLRVTVTEGKKNEIRIVLRACGCPVTKLHRISFGPIQLGNLSVGKIREINQKTIDALLKTL